MVTVAALTCGLEEVALLGHAQSATDHGNGGSADDTPWGQGSTEGLEGQRSVGKIGEVVQELAI